MMSIEAFREIISVAPAEGQRPMTDPNFEVMFNPDKFCYGTGTFSNKRPRKLTYIKYVKQRLLHPTKYTSNSIFYLEEVIKDRTPYIFGRLCSEGETPTSATQTLAQLRSVVTLYTKYYCQIYCSL